MWQNTDLVPIWKTDPSPVLCVCLMEEYKEKGNRIWDSKTYLEET